jgi:PRTRC genetic system protein C
MTDTTTPRRLFKTGADLIAETAETQHLSNEQVRDLLKHVYPELAHATIHERDQPDGTRLVEFKAVAGRKG